MGTQATWPGPPALDQWSGQGCEHREQCVQSCSTGGLRCCIWEAWGLWGQMVDTNALNDRDVKWE